MTATMMVLSSEREREPMHICATAAYSAAQCNVCGMVNNIAIDVEQQQKQRSEKRDEREKETNTYGGRMQQRGGKKIEIHVH
jgi:hypothetical protein